MAGMFSYSKAAMERAMKVQESFCEPWRRRSRGGRPRKVIGISDRHMRRWRERYEELGYDGLFDRRRGRAHFGTRIYVNHVLGVVQPGSDYAPVPSRRPYFAFIAT
jgi:hypothetical protein